jgi:nucleoside-diphosphate-sugar epimerase
MFLMRFWRSRIKGASLTKHKRVIVLGSSGFIGAHLVSRLQSQNYYVVGIDMVHRSDLTLGLNKADRFHQLALPDQHFIEILREIKPDAVINAAGGASVAHSLSDPAGDFHGSVNMCSFVLEALRKVLPECRFLFLSSAAVYGNPIALPIKESTPLKPISPYGYHKMMCETLLQEYFDIYGIRTSAVRIFSAYGPGLRKQILWDIYNKVITNNQVYLFGTGEETRDFIFILDIVRVIQLILEQSPFCADLYNVANGYEITIKILAQEFLSALGISNKEIVFSGETKLGDPKNWCAYIEKIKSLGYSPLISIEHGISEYAKWVLKAQGINR